jgi:hypothetical protein
VSDCDHCHYEGKEEHRLRLLRLLLVLLWALLLIVVLYDLYDLQSKADNLEMRVTKLEKPPRVRPAHAKSESDDA